MLDKILSHPLAILSIVYAGCIVTAIWMAITQRMATDPATIKSTLFRRSKTTRLARPSAASRFASARQHSGE